MVGKTVYTVNANTDLVDTWSCIGVINNKNGTLSLILERGTQHTVLPEKCVFLDKKTALIVAEKYKTK